MPVLINSSTNELSEATVIIGEFRHFHVALQGIGLLKYLKTIETRIKVSQNLTGTSLPEKCILSALLYIRRSYEATDLLDKVYGILGLLRGFRATL